PGISVVQSAQDRMRDDISKSLDWPRRRARPSQVKCGSVPRIVDCIPRKDAPKMLGVEHDQMVGAVRAENLIRLDLVTELLTVGRDDRTSTVLAEPAWLALQVQELPCG
ncbi:MAG: hypothetical protein ABW172_02320, partial [Candidatus Binatia bacterium]